MTLHLLQRKIQTYCLHIWNTIAIPCYIHLFPKSFSVGVLFSLTPFYTLARYSFALIHNCFLISQNVLQADLLYITENYLSSRYLYVMSNQLSLTYDYSSPFSFKTLCNIILFCCIVFTPRLTPLKLHVCGRKGCIGKKLDCIFLFVLVNTSNHEMSNQQAFFH